MGATGGGENTSAIALERQAECLEVCWDPNESKFLECGVAAGASYIVNEDTDVLDVTAYRGIGKVSAGELLAILSTGS